MKISRIASSFGLIALAIATVIVAQPGGKKPGGAGAAATTSSAATSSTTTGTTASTTTTVQQTLQEILEEPTSADNYRYDPQGRRDPFQSLIGPRPAIQPGQRPPGVPGFLVDEMKLQGVFETKKGVFTAMVLGPDNKGYPIRVGDKVLDGEVIRITPVSVVFRQEVNDPTRIERYKEVVKELTPEATKK
jgi:type IV pilus assembly protein PilP